MPSCSSCDPAQRQNAMLRARLETLEEAQVFPLRRALVLAYAYLDPNRTRVERPTLEAVLKRLDEVLGDHRNHYACTERAEAS